MERLKNKPFALVGMNTDAPETYKARAEREKISWRNSLQGNGGGPIVSEWGIHSFPTIYVLDAKGRIRYQNVRGEELENAVMNLLGELERASKPAETPRPADGSGGKPPVPPGEKP